MDKRTAARKSLRIKATLNIDGAESAQVNTVDIGKFGMCLVNIRQPVAIGQHVRIAFDILFSGKIHKVDIASRVAYCLHSDGEGFRAGLQFLDLHSPDATIIAQYIGN